MGGGGGRQREEKFVTRKDTYGKWTQKKQMLIHNIISS